MLYMGEVGEVDVIHKEKVCDVEWKIDFLSLSKEEDAYYESPDFLLEGDTWILGMYPNGSKSKDSVGYIHLTIYRRISTSAPINRVVSFALKTVSGLKNLEKHVTEFLEAGKSHGIHQFLARSDFERRKSEFLASRFLTVVCIFKGLNSAESARDIATAQCSYCEETFDTTIISSHEKKCIVKCPECLDDVVYQKWYDHECQISRAEDHTALCEDYKKVLKKGLNHDIILKVGDIELQAHQDILRARSRVFESMLSHDTKEKRSGVIDIHDSDPKTMGQFLSYIYSGKVDTMEESTMLQLYYVADKYDMKGLKEECHLFIKKSTTSTNICKVIQLALNHSDSKLLEHATQYFTDNMLDIMRTVEWQNFMKDNLTVANELTIKSVEKIKNLKL